LKDEIQHCKPIHSRPNINDEELKALHKLSNRTDIVIKKADKGGATVICSSEWYKKEAERQLSDATYYKQVEEDDTKKHEQIIKETLEGFVDTNIMEKKLSHQLVPNESRTPEFYLLPKIHKINNPGRPVISSTGCHTEKISAYVDQYLRPAAQDLPSHIKDSSDFIAKMRKIGRVSTEDILVTMDVSSLYTNIDNDEGINAIKVNKTITSKYSNSMISVICKLMRLILTLNNFMFNGKNYHQVKGTAMGTRAAPNYANIFMGWFEDKHVYKSKWRKHIRFYGRFIDDIILIWTGQENQLKDFIAYLNNAHPTIKFTSESSRRNINFLDVTLSKDEKGYLSTDVYQKPTDTHNYLHNNSSHPPHCMKSIPYSQFLRLKRLVSDPLVLKKRINEFTEYFVNSDYSRFTLKTIAYQILNQDSSQDQRSEKDIPTVRFLTTYN